MSDNAISISSRAFCTIITQSYIPFAKALHFSVSKFHKNFSFFVLVVDSEKSSDFEHLENLRWLTAADLMASESTQALFDKYQSRSTKDELRWALKPALLRWLLQNQANQVIYIDADVFFVGNADFLFEDLQTFDLLLTPHWYTMDASSEHFQQLFASGYFNAGFVAASRKGLHILQWWEEACLYKMEKSSEEGLYVDQRYLDIIPYAFKNVGIVQHKGCNLAIWNLDTNKRELVDGKLLIGGHFEPIFIHFSKETMQQIANGNDSLLLPYLNDYKKALGATVYEEYFKNVDTSSASSFITIKRKLLIRTRLKRAVFRLMEKL